MCAERLQRDELKLIGRDKELATIRKHLRDGTHLVVFGPAGIGKTVLVQEAICDWPAALYCGNSATLKTACESLLAALGLSVPMADNVTRKRAILKAVAGQKRVFVFDHLSQVSPRLLSFLAKVREEHVLVLVTRSLDWKAIGHLRMILYDCDRLEIGALPQQAMRQLLRANLDGCTAADEQAVLRICRGNPGYLLALCAQARRNQHQKGSRLNVRLLELDRRINQVRLRLGLLGTTADVSPNQPGHPTG